MTEREHAHAGGRLRVLPLLRRRWWLLALATAAVTVAAYFTASVQERTSTAEAVAIVNAGSDAGQPQSAADASALASTYAGLIPQDARIVRTVARRLQLSPQQVRERISVVRTQNTALLTLRFKAQTPELAIEGARALERAVHSGASRNIPRATLRPVRGPARPEAGSPVSDTALLMAGALVGVFLGVVLMVFLERADARADHERDLEEATGLPATRLGKHAAGPLAALLARWDSLAGERPARLALVPATRRAERATERAADALRAFVLARSPARIRVSAGDFGAPYDQDAGQAPLQIQAAAGPGREPSGESVALSSDVVVLVVRRGESLRRIGSRFRELRSLGIEVERTLLVPRRLGPAAERSGPGQ